MQLHYLLGFHSGMVNLPFLLLFEVTLLGKWFQALQEESSGLF